MSEIKSYDDVLNAVASFAPSLVPVFEYLRPAIEFGPDLNVPIDLVTDLEN